MIQSMTGFAEATAETPFGVLHLELRAVNHRFLEIHFRLSDEFRSLESLLRTAIAAKLARGKIDCRLGFVAQCGATIEGKVNPAALAHLLSLAETVHKYAPQSQALSVAEILRWPGVMESPAPQMDALLDTGGALLQRALADLCASRAREGAQLQTVILKHVADMHHLVAKVRPHIPQLIKGYQDKLILRLSEAGLTNEGDRIHQELTLFAQKIDVEEELNRISTHLAEVERVLNSTGPAGKRLDFLMQELNREANTLGSKSALSEVSQLAMDFKILIEQIREQIQNIE